MNFFHSAILIRFYNLLNRKGLNKIINNIFKYLHFHSFRYTQWSPDFHNISWFHKNLRDFARHLGHNFFLAQTIIFASINVLHKGVIFHIKFKISKRVGPNINCLVGRKEIFNFVCDITNNDTEFILLEFNNSQFNYLGRKFY